MIEVGREWVSLLALNVGSISGQECADCSAFAMSAPVPDSLASSQCRVVVVIVTINYSLIYRLTANFFCALASWRHNPHFFFLWLWSYSYSQNGNFNCQFCLCVLVTCILFGSLHYFIFIDNSFPWLHTIEQTNGQRSRLADSTANLCVCVWLPFWCNTSYTSAATIRVHEIGERSNSEKFAVRCLCQLRPLHWRPLTKLTRVYF